jgi:HEAT repeat protein
MRYAIALTALLLVGCSSSSHVVSSSHIIVGKIRPPISPSQVKLYLSPPKNFEEVAILNASSKHSGARSDQSKMDKVMERLKAEASKLGANGVLLSGVGDQYGGSVSTGSATATAYGNTAYGFGTGVSVPIMYKSGEGVAIYVPETEGNTTNDVGNPEVEELCLSLASDNPDDVEDALKTLRRMNAPEAVPKILPCLTNPHPSVIRDACRTLAVLGNKDVIPYIEPLLKNSRSDVRKDAQITIEKLQAK